MLTSGWRKLCQWFSQIFSETFHRFQEPPSCLPCFFFSSFEKTSHATGVALFTSSESRSARSLWPWKRLLASDWPERADESPASWYCDGINLMHNLYFREAIARWGRSNPPQHLAWDYLLTLILPPFPVIFQLLLCCFLPGALPQ